jgi:hypothetical protein
MSDVVDTSTDAFSRGQNHSGSVAVAPCGEAAVGTPQGSHGEPKACLSLAAPRTRHRRVGGRYLHHRCARPRATLDQLCPGCADRSVGTLTGHGGLGREHRFEVLDGDHLVVVNNTLGPDAGRVPVLVRGLLVQPRRLAPCPQVAVRWGLTGRPEAPGHPALGLAQFGCATLPLAPWRVFPLNGLGFRRLRPTRPWSPPSAAQHWRSSSAMSRTSPTLTPRPYLPAVASGFSGAFR